MKNVLIVFMLLMLMGCATTKTTDKLGNEIDGLKFDMRLLQHTVDSLKNLSGSTWEIR